MDNFTEVKLEIFAPQEYTRKIRDELAKIGVGRVGNYDNCVEIYPVQGYFRPLPGADPFEGEILLLFTRQMDMLMATEYSVEAVAQNFLAGNYRLESEVFQGG